jgi:sugar phosphate isomerase/epimerase
MYVSIFSDELGLDLVEAIPRFKAWGLEYVDLRGKIFGKALEDMNRDEILEVRRLLDKAGLKVGCMESSIAKVHLPTDAAVIKEQHVKLENLLAASEVLECRLLRCFHFWQGRYRTDGIRLEGSVMERVMELTRPLVEHANAGGLTVAFENCGARIREILAVMDSLGGCKAYLAWDPHNDWKEEAEGYGSEQAYIKAIAPISKVIHVKAQMALPEAGPVLPWATVLEELKRIGYRGPVSVETHAHEVKELTDKIGDMEVNRRLVAYVTDLVRKNQNSIQVM